MVHDFGSSESGGGKEGSGPLGTMAMDSAGNIYGVAEHGGSTATGRFGNIFPELIARPQCDEAGSVEPASQGSSGESYVPTGILRL